jgi:hypothetical protein
MQVTASKIAALLLALAYIVAAAISEEELSFTVLVAVAVVLPLALIWFPDEIESGIRLWRSGGIRGLHMKSSPAWLVSTMGWLFLVGLPLFLLLRQGL